MARLEDLTTGNCLVRPTQCHLRVHSLDRRARPQRHYSRVGRRLGSVSRANCIGPARLFRPSVVTITSISTEPLNDG